MRFPVREGRARDGRLGPVGGEADVHVGCWGELFLGGGQHKRGRGLLLQGGRCNGGRADHDRGLDERGRASRSAGVAGTAVPVHVPVAGAPGAADVAVTVHGHRRGRRHGGERVTGRCVLVLVGHRLARVVVLARGPVRLPAAVVGLVAGHAQPALHLDRVAPALLAVAQLLRVLERDHLVRAHRVRLVHLHDPVRPEPVPVYLWPGRGRGRGGRRAAAGAVLDAVVVLVVVTVVLRHHRGHVVLHPAQTHKKTHAPISYNSFILI